MATGNFLYDNRCIVVTDEDYEMGNIPPLGEFVDRSRAYTPSQFLSVSEDFHFWDIIITAGYYTDACIDYIRNERTAEYFLGDTMYYPTKRDLFNACKEEFGLSEYRLCKICGKVKNFPNYDIWIESAYENITEYLANNEERKVNEYLDGVKKNYGYEEYKIYARFSNGETMYQKIN